MLSNSNMRRKKGGIVFVSYVGILLLSGCGGGSGGNAGTAQVPGTGSTQSTQAAQAG